MNKKLIWIFSIFMIIGISSVISQVIIQDTGSPKITVITASEITAQNSTGGLFSLYTIGTGTRVAYSINDGGTWTETTTGGSCDVSASGRNLLLINSTDALINVCNDDASKQLNVTVSIDSGTNWNSFNIGDNSDYGVIQGFAGVISNDDEIVLCMGPNLESFMHTWNTTPENIRTAWTNQTTAVAQDFQRCNIKVDSTDRYHIFVSETIGNIVSYFNSTDPTIWGSEINVFSSGGFTDPDMGMAIGALNQVYGVIVDNVDNDLLFFNTSDNGETFGNATIPMLTTTLFNPDIVVDNNDVLHVTANNASNIIYSNSSDGGFTWSNAITLSTNSGVPTDVHLRGTKFPTFNNVSNPLEYIFSNATGIYFDNFTISFISISNVTVLLETPRDSLVTSTNTQTFRCSAITTIGGGINITNVTYNLWDSDDNVEATTFRDLNNNATTSNNTFEVASIPDDTYTWNCEYTDGTPTTNVADFNRTIIIDTTNPVLNLVLPVGVFSTTANVPLNYTTSDTNQDTCKFTTNSGLTNTTIASCGNTTFTGLEGANTLILYANDTAGNEVNNQTNFSITGVPQESGNFDVLEASFNGLQLYIPNGTATLFSATLFYNGSATPFDSFTSNGTGITLNKTILSPIISNDDTDKILNQSVTWNVTFREGNTEVNISSTITNQSVYQRFLNDCSTFTTTIAVNYTLRDESNDAVLTGNLSHIYNVRDDTGNILRTYNFSSFSVPSSAVCLFPAFGNFSANTQVHYSLNTTYDERDFIFDNLFYNNATRNITLLLLPSGDSVDVIVKVRDQNDNDLEGYTVQALRFNTITAVHEFVQSGITDNSGQILMQLDQTPKYRFIVSLDGIEKVRQDNVQLIGTSPTVILTVIIDDIAPIEPIINIRDFESSLVFNASGTDYNVSFNWNDTKNGFSQKCLTVNNDTISDTTELFNSCDTSIANEINFSLAAQIGGKFVAQSLARAIVDDELYTIDTLFIDIGSLGLNKTRLVFYGDSTNLANDGLFYSTLITMTMGGIGLSTGNPVVTVIMIILGLTVSFITGFLQLTTMGIMAFIAIGIFLVYMLRT